VRHSNFFEQRLRPLAPLPPSTSAFEHWDLDIVQDPQRRQEVKSLKDKTDVA
jgi:hypothetical protein